MNKTRRHGQKRVARVRRLIRQGGRAWRYLGNGTDVVTVYETWAPNGEHHVQVST